jgi:hypothetical protein
MVRVASIRAARHPAAIVYHQKPIDKTSATTLFSLMTIRIAQTEKIFFSFLAPSFHEISWNLINSFKDATHSESCRPHLSAKHGKHVNFIAWRNTLSKIIPWSDGNFSFKFHEISWNSSWLKRSLSCLASVDKARWSIRRLGEPSSPQDWPAGHCPTLRLLHRQFAAPLQGIKAQGQKEGPRWEKIAGWNRVSVWYNGRAERRDDI